jgi:cysteine-rich repeat protein
VCILQQCKPSVCGDGYVDTAQGEVCDDHNTANGDGCDPTCRYTGTVTTVAGKAGATSQYCDADGSGARFGQPTHVATDGTYIFVADTWENTIRKIALPNYTVTTLAGTPGTSGGVDGTGAAALFNAPKGLATDGQFGNYLFVADAGNHTIRRIRKATGVVDTIAGAAGQSGTANSTTGTSARFNGPSGLAYASQKLYVADTGNCAVRMIDLGTAGFPVYTIAGAPGTCGSTDGAAASARFRQPEALTLKGSSIYVADTANDCIRLIDFAGNVTTPYGTAGQWGSTDATGTSARFQLPGGIDYDPTTNKLFVADTNNNTVRRIDLATNAVTTLAGAAGTAGGDDGTGTAARFQGPHGLVVASGFFANDLLLADGDNSTIRRVAQANAAVATIAGAAPARGSSDGIGAAARFYRPWGIAALGGSLIVTDSGNRTVRQVSSGTWDVVTLAGSAGQANGSVVDGIGSNARFQAPHGAVAVGNLVYVADSYAIREVDPATNYITTRAGSGTQGFQDGDATTARFNAASSIASDGTYLYVGDSCTIRRVTLGAPWTVTTILGQFNSCTSADGQGTTTARVSPAGLATRGSHLYVADAMGALRDVDLSHQPPTIATVAGSLGTLGTTNGFGAQARFGALTAITLDGSSVFVVDNHLTGNLLREIDISTMRVTTLFGQLACVSAIDGDYSRAVIGGSSGLTYLPANGRVYIADATENALREVR